MVQVEVWKFSFEEATWQEILILWQLQIQVLFFREFVSEQSPPATSAIAKEAALIHVQGGPRWISDARLVEQNALESLCRKQLPEHAGTLLFKFVHRNKTPIYATSKTKHSLKDLLLFLYFAVWFHVGKSWVSCSKKESEVQFTFFACSGTPLSEVTKHKLSILKSWCPALVGGAWIFCHTHSFIFKIEHQKFKWNRPKPTKICPGSCTTQDKITTQKKLTKNWQQNARCPSTLEHSTFLGWMTPLTEGVIFDQTSWWFVVNAHRPLVMSVEGMLCSSSNLTHVEKFKASLLLWNACLDTWSFHIINHFASVVHANDPSGVMCIIRLTEEVRVPSAAENGSWRANQPDSTERARPVKCNVPTCVQRCPQVKHELSLSFPTCSMKH